MRILSMIIGLIGVVIAFLVNIFYSSFHVLGRVAGIHERSNTLLLGFVCRLDRARWLTVCPVYPHSGYGVAADSWHCVFLYRGLVGALGIPIPAGCSFPSLQAQQSVAPCESAREWRNGKRSGDEELFELMCMIFRKTRSLLSSSHMLLQDNTHCNDQVLQFFQVGNCEIFK